MDIRRTDSWKESAKRHIPVRGSALQFGLRRNWTTSHQSAMFCLFFILPFLLAPLSALSLPSNPSMIQLPSNATIHTHRLHNAEWPPVPWIYRSSDNTMAILFTMYGRQANISLTRQIISNLDSVIISLLHLPDDELGIGRFECTRGIVQVRFDVLKAHVRSTSMAVAVGRIRDLMGTEYNLREIAEALIEPASASKAVARVQVLYSHV